MPDKKETLKKLKNMFTQQGRLENKFAKHNKFNKKYTDLYNEHEQIKADTAREISRGNMTQAQVDEVSADLKQMRDKMAKIEERDLKLADRTKKLMGKIEKRMAKKGK